MTTTIAKPPTVREFETGSSDEWRGHVIVTLRMEFGEGSNWVPDVRWMIRDDGAINLMLGLLRDAGPRLSKENAKQLVVGLRKLADDMSVRYKIIIPGGTDAA